MKDRLLLVWLWLFAIPALLIGNVALENLTAWTSQVQQALKLHAGKDAPDVAFLRDGVGWSWIAVRWLLMGTLVFGLVEAIRAISNRGAFGEHASQQNAGE
ncbi:hypothetical protein [Verrucomicrobium spinosum]|uniref:hypothetical protein n=1 Tax=Verrucomicrobium spinosum TaxID=2736 RepID=UPI0001746037|nr:hypothetical protein [Verrucomicrobium spinosum]